MQRHAEPLDSFLKPSLEMQQYLVSEIKTHTSPNAHELESVKMKRGRQIYCHTCKEKTPTFLESWEGNNGLTAVKIVPWGGFGFFQWWRYINLFPHNTFVFTLLKHTIKIAIQKSILYLNVRRLRFQLFASKSAPTENVLAHSLLGGKCL